LKNEPTDRVYSLANHLISQMDRCQECLSFEIHEDTQQGQIVCLECGLVQSSYVLSDELEFKEKQERHDDKDLQMGLSTVMSVTTTKLSKLQTSVTITKGLSKRIRAYKQIQSYGKTLNLSAHIIQSVSSLYERVYDLKQMKHTNNVILACYYIITTNEQLPRSFFELQNISGVPYKKIYKFVKRVKCILDLSLSETNPMEFVPKYCSYFKINYTIEKAIILFLTDLRKLNYSSQTIACASIIHVGKKHGIEITPERFSDLTSCSITMIQLCCMELSDLESD